MPKTPKEHKKNEKLRQHSREVLADVNSHQKSNEFMKRNEEHFKTLTDTIDKSFKKDRRK